MDRRDFIKLAAVASVGAVQFLRIACAARYDSKEEMQRVTVACLDWDKQC